MKKTPEGEDIIQQILSKGKHISLPNTLKKEKKEEDEIGIKNELKNEDIAKIPKKIIDLELVFNL